MTHVNRMWPMVRSGGVALPTAFAFLLKCLLICSSTSLVILHITVRPVFIFMCALGFPLSF